jgi:hypothetical protein
MERLSFFARRFHSLTEGRGLGSHHLLAVQQAARHLFAGFDFGACAETEQWRTAEEQEPPMAT